MGLKDKKKEFDLRILSLGAGVQSTAVYLMADEGLFGERPDYAIFADTQAEPPWVYEHLDRLEARGTIPIRRVSAGSLEQDVLRSRDGRSRFASLPLRVKGRDGRSALLRRQCTREYKIDPIKKEIRALLGLKKGQRAAGRYLVEEWIGISKDEAQRAKPSRTPWIKTRWPLLFDLPMARHECQRWMQERGYELPRKSSCYFCPFHDDRYWAWMKAEEPAEFQKAVEFDREIRRGKLNGVEENAYLHRSLKPLEEVDFGSDTTDQLEIDFGNECEGMCGV